VTQAKHSGPFKRPYYGPAFFRVGVYTVYTVRWSSICRMIKALRGPERRRKTRKLSREKKNEEKMAQREVERLENGPDRIRTTRKCPPREEERLENVPREKKKD